MNGQRGLPVGHVVRHVSPVKHRDVAESAVEDAYVAYQLVLHPVVTVPRVEVEFANALRPENVLALERSVEDAAVIVIDPAALKLVPFMVPSAPERRPVPIVVVDTSLPVVSTARSAEAREEKYCEPVVVAFTASVDEAISCVPFNQRGVVVD